jgi:hypothetical protein
MKAAHAQGRVCHGVTVTALPTGIRGSGASVASQLVVPALPTCCLGAAPNPSSFLLLKAITKQTLLGTPQLPCLSRP